MEVNDWFGLVLGVASTISGLAWHYRRYRKTINQIADDVEWHVNYRDRTW